MTSQQALPEIEEQSRALIDQLIAETRLYSSSESLKELLQFTVRLRHMAPFNAMLLHIQKPGLSYAMTARDWWERFLRRPTEHARPLLILRNFGPVDFVYDVLDTDGAPLPPSVYTFPTRGSLPAGWFNFAERRLSRAAIKLVWPDHGDRSAGSVRLVHDYLDAKRLNDFRMTINRNHPPETQFVTLLHELGHVYLGHQGGDAKRNVRTRRSAPHGLREVEAESVAWLVAKRSGLMPRSESYLDAYKGNFADLDLHTVMRAANAIEQLLKLPLGGTRLG